MLRFVALLLSIFFTCQCALAGTLTKNEVWSGDIVLKEDVIIPFGYTLTFSPGTQIVTNGKKIISYGRINILGENENKVRLLSFKQNGPEDISVVKLKPYNIDTETLKKEFQVFKIQYAILWSALFASMFIMLEGR